MDLQERAEAAAAAMDQTMYADVLVRIKERREDHDAGADNAAFVVAKMEWDDFIAAASDPEPLIRCAVAQEHNFYLSAYGARDGYGPSYDLPPWHADVPMRRAQFMAVIETLTRDPDTRVRAAATQNLHASLDRLRAAVSDPAPLVRAAVPQHRDFQRIEDTMEALSRDPDPTVRRSLASCQRILAHRGVLERLLADPDPGVAEQAASTRGLHGWSYGLRD